jgi:acetoin utilization deacetylase AcuC-like enzyme
VAVNRAGFKLSGKDYYEMGLLMGSFMKGSDIPTVFVQEGGYKMDTVGLAAAHAVGGYADGASKK